MLPVQQKKKKKKCSGETTTDKNSMTNTIELSNIPTQTRLCKSRSSNKRTLKINSRRKTSQIDVAQSLIAQFQIMPIILYRAVNTAPRYYNVKVQKLQPNRLLQSLYCYG